jgi:pimeloyl-ACP methyl ester carboxylesterase
MADPVVFVPGLALTARLFEHQVRTLAADRTLVLANHRRHDDLAALAGALLPELPARFVLAGLSMGGYVAFEILRQAPERVAALVLMDTTARPDADAARERRLAQIALAEDGRYGEIPALQLPLLVAPERAGDPDVVAAVRAMMEETGAESFVRQQRAIMGRPDSRPLLPAISCPTLVVVGDRDALTPPDHAAEIAEAVPGARLATMPLCGHLSALERPEAVSHALAAFLDGLPR